MVYPVGVFVFCGARAWAIGPIDLRAWGFGCDVGVRRSGLAARWVQVHGKRAGRCHPAFLTTKGHEGKKCFCMV